MTTYLAVAWTYWGRGVSEEAALAQCRKAGAAKSAKTIIYRNDHGDQDKPYVDNGGATCYFGELTCVAEYNKGKRQESATV